MQIYQIVLLMWIFGTFQWLAIAADWSVQKRYRFFLLDELVVAFFWPITMMTSVFKAMRHTKNYKSRW